MECFDHHLLLQSILSGPGYHQSLFDSLHLFQPVLQMFHRYLQVNVTVKPSASLSGLPVDML